MRRKTPNAKKRNCFLRTKIGKGEGKSGTGEGNGRLEMFRKFAAQKDSKPLTLPREESGEGFLGIYRGGS